MVLLLSGIGYAGYIYMGYAKGQAEYRSLKEDFTRPKPNQETDDAVPAANTKTDETQENDMADKTIWKPLINVLPADAPERLTVDWEQLIKKNDDLVGWIMVPAVDISYPVVQRDNNEYYLHRDISRNYLYAGSIFMDAYNTPSFYNYNTILYGHNMRNGSMFAGLKDFNDAGTYEKCRYFWILTPDADYLYEICSVHPASSGSDTFTVRFTDYDHYKKWQDEMLSLSAVATGVKLEYQDRIVTLSTCTENSSIRMTVQGKLVWKTF